MNDYEAFEYHKEHCAGCALCESDDPQDHQSPVEAYDLAH